MQNGSDIIRWYLRSYPELNNTIISRTIAVHHPQLYKDVEVIRRKVREIISNEPEFVNRTDTRTLSNFPEPNEANQVKTFVMKEGNKNILVIADFHMPYYSRDAVELALEYAKKHDIDTILILGDLLDFYSISRFLVNPLQRDLAMELNSAKDFLLELRREFPSSDIYYKLGNHEFWWERYLWTNAPLLIGVREFELKNVLELDKLDIVVIPDKSDIRITENLSAIHGHEIMGGSTINPAHALYRKFKENVLCGHFHKPSHFSTKTGTGKIKGAWSIGCMSLLRPEFMPINEWLNGFAHVRTEGDEFSVENFQIINSKVYHA